MLDGPSLVAPLALSPVASGPLPVGAAVMLVRPVPEVGSSEPPRVPVRRGRDRPEVRRTETRRPGELG